MNHVGMVANGTYKLHVGKVRFKGIVIAESLDKLTIQGPGMGGSRIIDKRDVFRLHFHALPGMRGAV